MNDRDADLRAAVAALAQLQASFTAQDRDEGWRHRLVQRRRLLQGNIATVAQAWQAVERDVGTTEAGQRFRRALVQLRARVAEHQAAWPAIAIDDNDPAFVASRDAMRAATADFHAAAAALPNTFNSAATSAADRE